MAFRDVFNALLASRNWKQADFCRVSGMSRAYVSQIATGQTKDPSFEKACIIADVFGVTLEELRQMLNESSNDEEETE